MSTIARRTTRHRDPVTHARTSERGRADERARTQAWLHDRTLQMLEYIAAGGYDDEVTVARLREVAALAADELRDFIGEAAVPPPGDLRAVLADAVARCQLLAGPLRIQLACEGPLPLLGASRVAALAGATREALNNVCKHARAAHAVVSCVTEPSGEVVISIRDDGIGFDPAQTGYGLGLAHSVVERMLACGGQACVESAPGAGTVITLRLGARTTLTLGQVAA